MKEDFLASKHGQIYSNESKKSQLSLSPVTYPAGFTSKAIVWPARRIFCLMGLMTSNTLQLGRS